MCIRDSLLVRRRPDPQGRGPQRGADRPTLRLINKKGLNACLKNATAEGLIKNVYVQLGQLKTAYCIYS